MGGMKYDVFVDPGQKLKSPSLMRDYSAVGTNQSTGVSVIVVGDMANNLVGHASHKDPKIAQALGLERDADLNGGLIGSYILRNKLVKVAEHGPAVVEAANTALRETYSRLHMDSTEKMDPAERFTGYMLHAVITQETTCLTSIGDVYAWINGELVAGEEKNIDIEKRHFIDELVANHENLKEKTHSFADRIQLDEAIEQELLTELKQSIGSTKEFTPQTAYLAVEMIITPWQIRVLQNNPSHSLGYGAIDGTTTGKQYIHTLAFKTSDIDTLVIATDGSQPIHPRVTSAADLEPVNPIYSEQTVVTIHPNE